MKDIANSSV